MRLEYEFLDGKQRLEMEGSVNETVYAVGFLIGSIYTNIRRSNEAAAESFKNELQKMVCEKRSKIWDFRRSGQVTAIVVDPEELRKQMELNNIEQEEET